MRLLIPAYFLALLLTGTDSPTAYTAAVSGPLFGFLALARLAYLLTRQRPNIMTPNAEGEA